MPSQELTSAADIERVFQEREAKRPIYWFDVPHTIAAATGVQKLGLIELLASEEIHATKRGDGNQYNIAGELARACVRFVNDDRVSDHDNTLDAFWGNPRPQQAFLRKMVVSAYAELHNPKNVEVESFLKSKRVELA